VKNHLKDLNLDGKIVVLMEIRYDDLNWINLSHDINQWKDFI
jgi:hypothetical protein